MTNRQVVEYAGTQGWVRVGRLKARRGYAVHAYRRGPEWCWIGLCRVEVQAQPEVDFVFNAEAAVALLARRP